MAGRTAGVGLGALVVTVLTTLGVAFPSAGTHAATRSQPPVGTHELPSPPFAVWPELLLPAGGRLVVWSESVRRPGGVESFAATYDPTTARWRKASRAPFGVVSKAVGVATGATVVILGARCGGRLDAEDRGADEPRCAPGGLVGGVYDPRRDTWRTIPTPKALTHAFPSHIDPFAGRGLGWTGTQAVFEVKGRVFAFDPAGDRWRSYPTVPGREACVVGPDVVAVRAAPGPSSRSGRVRPPSRRCLRSRPHSSRRPVTSSTRSSGTNRRSCSRRRTCETRR